MSKKFTEEQYQKIVEVQEKEFSASILAGSIKKNFWSALDSEIADFINYFHLYDETAAIANPLTREWAHDQFVEKEKKYVWQSKQETDDGKVKRLYDAAIGITDSFKEKTEPIHNGNLITETEVKKWGYNPDMFDREEVK